MPGVFVTATGTDVGKTYVTAGLIRAGRRAGLAMDALKPVMTGHTDADVAQSDAAALLNALGRDATADAVARIAPWRFAAPLAPSMAAPLEGRRLDVAALVSACHAAVRADALTLIEGIGGVMVPLDDRSTVLDVIAALTLPVLLVSGTQLGALSHALTAHEVLRARKSVPCLLVLNESLGATVPLEATRTTLAARLPDTPVVMMSREADDAAFDTLLATMRQALELHPSRAPRSLA